MTLADQIALMEEGKIVQCAPPRELYNHPADRFGGWFLGNPGMVFFDGDIEADGGTRLLMSPLFPAPVAIDGAIPRLAEVTFGIRPEHIRISTGPSRGAVRGELVRKTVQIGGQYLVSLRVDGLLEENRAFKFKAKVSPSAGERLPAAGPISVELPLDQVSLFDAAGNRIAANLHVVQTPVLGS